MVIILTKKILVKKGNIKKGNKKKVRVKNKSSFDPIIFRSVERVVGGHLEGFDHKTVRN